jgi:hypothetical protein
VPFVAPAIVSGVLTIADIPVALRKGQEDGEDIALFTAGIQQQLGLPHEQALMRFIQAGVHFRDSEIGREMTRSPQVLVAGLGQTPQLVELAGGVLAATSLVAALDLSAAALQRLYIGPINPANPGIEADMGTFHPEGFDVPPAIAKWHTDTRADNQWSVLRAVRHHLVHRWFPVHITVTLGSRGTFLQEIEVRGERHSLERFLDDGRAFVIDRLVAIGLAVLALPPE